MEAGTLDDRRTAWRVPVAWRVRDIQPSGHRVDCTALNITLSGVLLEYRSYYTVPTVLELELDVGAGKRVYCEARVVRDEITAGGARLCAAEFTHFHADGLSMLQDAMERVKTQGGRGEHAA